mmetsp:Transcript_10767/g.35281  ORF Transcript_10767/g.35281 Transcript_10767/m.35281 type:complete len:299 (-) Transcript_10767:12-908(-)
MGVKGLNSWIAASFPGVMQPAAQGGKGKFSRPAPPPCPYDHVMLDANGIVHRACRSRSSEREVIRAIVCEIDAVLRAYPARESVLIALDGPGPLAKLLEQRKRRIERVLKAGRDAEAAVVGSKEYLRRAEIAEREGRPFPPSVKKKRRRGTDSLQVTPGTGFMLRLRRALDWYAASRLAGEGGLFRGAKPPLFYLSAADVAGEGEIKLLQHLHCQLRLVGGARPTFLLVGPDADLLLLGLAAGSRCDVLTTDADGSRCLFSVEELCSCLERQVLERRVGESTLAAEREGREVTAAKRR